MNKNSENYKNTFSQICPSDDSVERIMNMTKEKSKSYSFNFKKLASVVTALVLFVSGGFGINYAVKNNNSADEFGVIVAYASTGEFYKAGKQSKQDLLYELYIMPEDDNKKAKAAYEKWLNSSNKAKEQASKLGEDGFWTSFSGVNLSCYDSAGKETASLHSVEGGILALNLYDYKDVKTFQVENSSKYGYIVFEHLAQFEKLVKISKNDNNDLTDEETRNLYGIGHKFKITGDELRASQKDGTFGCGGIKNPVNVGYNLRWYPSDELCDAIGNDTSFDLTQIKDTITFTVEFNDSTVKSASTNLFVDKNGCMHFE